MCRARTRSSRSFLSAWEGTTHRNNTGTTICPGAHVAYRMDVFLFIMPDVEDVPLLPSAQVPVQLFKAFFAGAVVALAILLLVWCVCQGKLEGIGQCGSVKCIYSFHHPPLFQCPAPPFIQVALRSNCWWSLGSCLCFLALASVSWLLPLFSGSCLLSVV
ncbi:hypothetical protein CLOM_g3009 [Closterium sp. NIES-68]|nr:hypothetical protein CLOM_g3009 [Closterium sp. NIES-68]GJP76987.1 hypothetical protein CLOP_g7425 [Closterium sp. NIES-67]